MSSPYQSQQMGMGMGMAAMMGMGNRTNMGSPEHSNQWNASGHGGGPSGMGMGSGSMGLGGGDGNQGSFQQYTQNGQPVQGGRYRSNRGYSQKELNRFAGRGGHQDDMNPPSLQEIATMDPRQLTRSNINLGQLVEAGVIEKLARDQNGSRFIQQRLETASLQDKEGVFRQIKRNALALCEDVFGNYVIQKFFEL